MASPLGQTCTGEGFVDDRHQRALAAPSSAVKARPCTISVRSMARKKSPLTMLNRPHGRYPAAVGSPSTLNRLAPAATLEWLIEVHGRRVHARQETNRIDQLAEIQRPRGWLLMPLRQQQIGSDGAIGVDTEIDPLQRDEALHQQAGADQQHHGQRRFADDQQAAEASFRLTARLASRVLLERAGRDSFSTPQARPARRSPHRRTARARAPTPAAASRTPPPAS